MKINRLLGILNILANTDRITIQELAERFEVSKRTIFRDIDALNESGVPIVTYSGIGGGAWKEHKNNGIQPVVEYAIKHHIPVAAICNAANFMVENGYLDNIRHSGNILDYMESQAPPLQR